MDETILDRILSLVSEAVQLPCGSSELVELLSSAGIDPALVEQLDADQVLETFSQDLPKATSWEYWGNGTHWERASDGSYTGNHSGWDS